METIYKLNSKEINLVFLNSLREMFLDQDLEITVKPISKLDNVTIISENSLAEEWDSTEDQRWDKLL